MSSTTLYRANGLALLLGAVLVIVGLGGFVNVFLSGAMLLGLVGLGWMGYALLTGKGAAEAVPQAVPAS